MRSGKHNSINNRTFMNERSLRTELTFIGIQVPANLDEAQGA